MTRRNDKPGSRIADYGRELRGLGGLQTARIRALRGSTFGAANRGRRLSATERAKVEAELRQQGKL